MTDLVPVLALMMLVANVILSFGFYGGFYDGFCGGLGLVYGLGAWVAKTNDSFYEG